MQNLHKFTEKEALEIDSETNTLSETQESSGENWDGLPEGCQKIGQKGLIQFLKTKVTILQTQLDVFKTKYKSKVRSSFYIIVIRKIIVLARRVSKIKRTVRTSTGRTEQVAETRRNKPGTKRKTHQSNYSFKHKVTNKRHRNRKSKT